MDKNSLHKKQENQEYASFWLRFLAYSIDGIILFIIGLSLGFSFAFASSANHQPNIFASISGLIIGIAYFLFFWVNQNGQTLGHKLLAIRVAKEDGQPIDIGTAVVRYIGYIVSSFIFCLGFLWIIWDSKKQGWHDKMAGTIVIKTEKKPHLGAAIAIVIIWYLFCTGLIIGGIFLIILGTKLLQSSKNQPVLFEQAVSSAINTYRTTNNLPVINQQEVLCAYAQKRIEELTAFKNFDNHQGFIEDDANPQMRQAYFSQFGQLEEVYATTGLPTQATQIVNQWAMEKNSSLSNPAYINGCVQSDATYTVLILATPPSATPNVAIPQAQPNQAVTNPTPYVYTTPVYPTIPAGQPGSAEWMQQNSDFLTQAQQSKPH